MATPDKGHGHPNLHPHPNPRPLPKFGEWDVKNPATSEGFTVIFQKARDDKKTTGGPGNVRAGIPPAFRNGGDYDGGYRPDFKYGDTNHNQYTPPKRIKKKWAFCGC